MSANGPEQHDTAQPSEDEPGPYSLHWDATRKFLLRTLAALAIAFATTVVVVIGYVAYLVPTTPSVDDLRQARIAQPSVLLSSDGHELASFRRTQQERVDLKHVSPYVIKALIATEDRRFYQHHGVDFGRTLAAVFHTIVGDVQGGSTLTQQLARNLFPEEIGRSRSVDRKFREMITALKIERLSSKEQILETYLNTAPFLYNVFGIEMAARTYYDKSAADLDALESATLIGMLKGTYYYNPLVNPERALKRRNVVLSRMVKHGDLPQADYDALRVQPLKVGYYRQPDSLGVAPHFASSVRKWLIEWADQNDYDIYADGLVVHTTLDLALQEAATRAVESQAEALQAIADVEWAQKSLRVSAAAPAAYRQLRSRIDPFSYFWASHRDLLDTFIRETPEYRKAVKAGETDARALAALQSNGDFIARLRAEKTRLEAGFVAIDPASGEIRAWVGSRDFQRDQFDHVAQAERQPGSTFKPIVYGTALEHGIAPEYTYIDNPIEVRFSDGKVWRPTDMTGASGQPMTLRDGLVHSKNTITVQVMQDVGVPSIVRMARALGVAHSKLDPVPSIALGTSPVTLLEMVSSYSTIARLGEFREPVLVTRITDRSGKELARFRSELHRAMSERSSVELIDMMRGVVTQGTGQAIKGRFGIVADIAGKTGTTQNNTDGWFILMHPNLVAGAWVGFNDARVTMRSNYWGQGGHNAIYIVGDFFRDALNTKLIDVKAQFPKPDRPQVIVANAPPENWMNQLNGGVEIERPPTQQPGSAEAPRRDVPIIIIRDPPRTEETSAPKTAQEVGQILSGMGRDPASGAPVETRTAAPADVPSRAPAAPVRDAISIERTPARSEPDPVVLDAVR